MMAHEEGRAHQAQGRRGLATRKRALPGRALPLVHTGDTHGTALWSGCSTHSHHSWSILLWLNTSETPAIRKGSFSLHRS